MTRNRAFWEFAQSFDTRSCGGRVYQSANVENSSTTYIDIRLGSIPLDASQYGAESATLTETSLVTDPAAANRAKVDNLNLADSSAKFTAARPTTRSHPMNVRYGSGIDATSTQPVEVTSASATYPASVNRCRVTGHT